MALWPGAEAVEHLRPRIGRAKATSRAELRWEAEDRWHITLNFVGDVAASELARLSASIAQVADATTASDLRLAGSGTFGSVLWVGVAAGEWLHQLAGSLADRLQPGAEHRAFRPHLTLARGTRRSVPAELVAGLADYEGPCWTPREIVLVASITGPAPVYEKIDRWQLNPEPGKKPGNRRSAPSGPSSSGSG